MTWTSDNRAQRACLKGTSGPKGPKPICYSVLGYISANINGGLKHLAQILWCPVPQLPTDKQKQQKCLAANPPGSPDLTTWVSSLIPRVKSLLWGFHFQDVLEIQKQMLPVLSLYILHNSYIFKIMCVTKELEYCWTWPSLHNYVKWYLSMLTIIS